MFGWLLAGAAQPPPDFACPMHPDVRLPAPGKCPRCGMALEARISEPEEFPLRITFDPPRIPAGQPLRIRFRASNPKTGGTVRKYQMVHEKYLHLFIVSSDLGYFSHEHPMAAPNGEFVHTTQLPRPGVYKLIADFYPEDGTPQLITKIVSTAGYRKSLAESYTVPAADLAPKRSENMEAELRIEPAQPIAGRKTLLFLHLKPAAGLEPYLGAWAHMLIASNDLIDDIHDHPSIADGGADMQFDVFFPREAVYRIWIQVQRQGKVNTFTFTVPATELR